MNLGYDMIMSHPCYPPLAFGLPVESYVAPCPKKEQKHSSLKLFVGGLLGSFTSEELHDYFRQFGDIEPISEDLGQKVSPERPLNKGFAVITCRDRETYFKIRDGFHMFKSSTLHISEYKSGPKLHEELLEVRQRKVIFKNLHAKISEEELKQKVEAHFGPISSIYFIKDHQTKKN